MSYLKLFTVVQDFPLGFQTLNQAIDNNQAQQDLWSAKHSIGVAGINTGGASTPTVALGRHNDILVARTTSRWIVDAAPFLPILTGPISGPLINGVPLYLGTGQWRFYIRTPQLFGAHAAVEATATADRKATCLVEYNPMTGPSIVVSTWNVATPALANLNFSLTIWSQIAS